MPSKNNLWLVVLAESHEAGFVRNQMKPDLNEAFGYDIFLDAKFCSQGIGRETMNRSTDFVRARGIRIVKICVSESNNVARSLYQSLGFKKVDFNTERRQYTLALEI